MSFKVIVRNWVNGNLEGMEEEVGSLEEAMEHVARHDEHHRKHSQGHLLKVLDENGEVAHFHQGNPDSEPAPATESYA
jgi:hypothetical protein